VASPQPRGEAVLAVQLLAMLGLIGGPLALVTATAVLFGAREQVSGVSFLFTLPEAVWELSLGICLIVKGFKTPSSLLEGRRQSALDETFGPTVAAG
jgi:uncharacterized membrane protein YkgB